MNYRALVHIHGTGVVEKWFKTRWAALLFRLWHWDGWIDNGLHTKDEVHPPHEPANSHKLTLCKHCGLSNTYWERFPTCRRP